MPAQTPGKSKQDYATPVNFITAVKAWLGIQHFAFDFAADHVNAKAPKYFSVEDNALAEGRRWADHLGPHEWGWLNPPFGNIHEWAWRCAEAAAHVHIAFLVPASVGANWYRDFVHQRARVLALNGRLAFMPDRPDWLYPKDCILALYGPDVVPDFEVWTWNGRD